MNKKLLVVLFVSFHFLISNWGYAQNCLEYGNIKIPIESDAINSSYPPEITVAKDKLLINYSNSDGSVDSYGSGIFTSVYKVVGKDGVVSNLPITISPTTLNLSEPPSVLLKYLSNGNVVVTWYSSSSSNGITDAYFKIIDLSGNVVVATTKINTLSGGLHRFTQVEQLSNGNIVFTWDTGLVDGSGYAMRRFTMYGTAVDADQISIRTLAGITTAEYECKIATNANGKFMLFISSNGQNYKAMIFNNDAAMPNSVFVPAQAGPTNTHYDKTTYIKTLPNGKFLLVYRKQVTTDVATRSIAYKIYNDDGTIAKDEVVYNTIYSWGYIGEPLLSDTGVLINYSYNDLHYGPNLGFVSHSDFFDFDLNFVADYKSCYPALTTTGITTPFEDIDGGFGMAVNDQNQSDVTNQTTDLWLLRRTMDATNKPLIKNPTFTNIGNTGAVLGANVESGAVTERGIVYALTATNSDPIIGGTGVTKVTKTGTTGVFTNIISGLTASSAYTFKGYATNAVGTNYTFANQFTTSGANSGPSISYETPQNYELNKAITALNPTSMGSTIPALTYKQVSTVAGTTAGFLDGTGTAAKMDGPLGMKLDADGNVYFIDSANQRIRKMTPSGVVTTIAGDGYYAFFYGRFKDNATGTVASFNWPSDLALDTTNNCLYVADKENDRIRKVSLTAPYAVTTFAGSGTSSSVDGIGTAATFKKPSGITIDPSGTYLYVTDRAGNKIRRITISSAQVVTIAGSGTQSTLDNATGTAATFNDPTGIAVDANFVYVSDFGGHKIRKIAKTSPYAVTTIAGSGTKSSVDGSGTAATFDNPYGMTIDGAGNLLVAEWGNKIRKITPSGLVSTIAGSGTATSVDGNGVDATFNNPANIVINPTTGIAYVSEWTGDRIRKINLGGYTISASLPAGLSFNGTNGTISGTPTAVSIPTEYTVSGYNYYGKSTAVISISIATVPTITTTGVSAITTTTASSGGNVLYNGGAPLLEKGICWSLNPNPTISDHKIVDGTTDLGVFTNAIIGLNIGTTYYVKAYASNAVATGYSAEVSFTTAVLPPNIAYNTTNNFIVNSAISSLTPNNTGGNILLPNMVSSFAGTKGVYNPITDGQGVSAVFSAPASLSANASGNIFVSEIGSNLIRKITASGFVSTIAGGTAGSFNNPSGVAADNSGNVYVADSYNNRIQKITPSGVVSTLAGTGIGGYTDGIGTSAQFNAPAAIAVDASGNVYVADGSYTVRKITPEGNVSTLAGGYLLSGDTDGLGSLARFGQMKGIAVDAFGNVYVADKGSCKIKKITPSGNVSTISGNGCTDGALDGPVASAKFGSLNGMAIDDTGNLFVIDYGKFNADRRIRKITSSGIVSTVAGSMSGYTDGLITSAQFSSPMGIAVDALGSIYVGENVDQTIRKITQYGYTITPSLPAGLVLSEEGSISGTPTVLSAATDYTITARNSGGSSSFTIRIAVTDASSTPTWTGTEWINGTATAATPAIIEGNYTSGGDLEVGELTIKNNATVVFQSGHNLTINGKLTVESGSELLLESNANLVQTTNDTNSGLITIKRNTAPLKRLDYVLWSSPVTGQQLQSFSPATLSNRFYTYDGTTNVYSAVSSPNTTDFEKGTGFLIRMPNDHPTTPTIWTGTFTGVPNNGYLTVMVNTGGYTALGNPYPSTIDADAFIDANSITDALYFWRKTNNSANPSYATYTKAGGVGTANSADPNGLIPNGVIQVGQGFIAAVNYIDAVFTNAMRTTNNGNQFLKTKNTDKSRIWLNLTNDSGFFSQTLVAYMDKATSGIDAAIDGRYFNDSKTALTSIIKNEEFTIQGRSLPFDASDVVPLGFKTETAGDFTLAIDHTDGLFATGQKVFLKDNLTNTLHDLSTGSYAFTSAAGVFNTRFEFRYQQALGTIENELEANAIVVYKQNDKIKIDAGTQNIAGVKVYDIGGRLLVERKDINANTALIAVNGTTQVLLVHVITQEGSVVIKKIIQ